MGKFFWTQTHDIGPGARVAHAMCFNKVRKRTVLHGGANSDKTLLADTWELGSDGWTQIADTGPDPRRNHALCFEGTAGASLLFGGVRDTVLLGDTWSLSGDAWTQVEDSGPSARSGHSLAFDEASGRAVLFGGEGAAGLLNDTWQWDPGRGTWTQVDDTGPTARRDHMMVFDVVNARLVLFGGRTAADPLGDTWFLDAGGWTQASQFGAPPCWSGAMASSDVSVVLYGGLAKPPTMFSGTWQLVAKRWTQVQDIGPGPRWGHALAFDAARRSIVLFGGSDKDAIRRDTWEHIETDDPLQLQEGLAPTLATVSLQPSTAPAGSAVTIKVTLAGTRLEKVVVDLAWITKAAFEAANAAHVPPGQAAITMMPSLLIPAGQLSAVMTVSAPPIAGPFIVFAAASDGKVQAAELDVT